jgi:hypothetical protein
MSEGGAGPENSDPGADPSRFRGRLKTMEMYERTGFHRTCRGISDGMQAKWTMLNTGSPSGDRSVGQLATRERKAGLTGMAERLVVPRKPGNSGVGKGLETARNFEDFATKPKGEEKAELDLLASVYRERAEAVKRIVENLRENFATDDPRNWN